MTLWPLLPLDAKAVAELTPELREHFYRAVRERRGEAAEYGLRQEVETLEDMRECA